MISKGSKKGTTRFAYKPKKGPAGKVSLVGSFSSWEPVTMRKQKDGSYVVNVPLQPGTYEYKFIVDDQWQLDPDNPSWTPNPFGTMNSIAHAE